MKESVGQLHLRYRPTTFDDFVGLERPVRICRALATNPHSAALFFVGHSGVGKTALALTLAKAIPAQMTHVSSSKCNLEFVEQVIKTCRYMPWPEDYRLVLVDEADQMTKSAQHVFLSVLDGTTPPYNTVFVFTANTTKGLEKRFLSRTIVETFAVEDEQIMEVLERVWLKEGFDMDKPDLAAIAAKAEGNIRAALMTMEAEMMVAV